MADEHDHGAATETPNKVEITDVGPSKKKLTIEIPAETVDEQFDAALDAIATEAPVKGFRKGHAPKHLLQRRFGNVVRREAKNSLVASAYSRAVEDHKLRVIGQPSGAGLEEVEVEPGKPVKFEVEVEVAPEFELPSLEGLKVFKPTIEVNDELVEGELKTLQLHEGSLEERQSPEPGDYLTGHGMMKNESGETILDINDAVIQVPPPEKEGKGMILGIMVDDFAAQLGLPEPGKTATIKAMGPENHENESIRGKPITMTFTVGRVDRIIPAPEADLVARFGAESGEELRNFLRERITRRLSVEQQNLMRQQIAAYLLDHVEMELPERVTAAQAERNLSRRRLELKQIDKKVIRKLK